MRYARFAMLLPISITAATPVRGEALVRACIAPASLVSPSAFRRYPAKSWRGRWHRPNVRAGEAHRYRTVVRAEGKGPPNFAGHVTLLTHGCGAGMTCPMFLDLATGKVGVAPSLKSVEWDFARGDAVARAAGIEDSRLIYHRDSRLLVALGTRNEDLKLNGAALFEWRGSGLKLIRFVPERMLCPEGN